MSNVDCRDPIYLIERYAFGYRLLTIHRVLHYDTDSGKHLVRYDRFWHPLHPKEKLQPWLKQKSKKTGAVITLEAEQIDPSRVAPLPFVKDWEAPVAEYKTFGPGGI